MVQALQASAARLIKAMATSALLGALLVLVSFSSVLPAEAATVEVKLGTDGGMLAFEPSVVTINKGDTIRFVNNNLAPHNAVFDGHEELSHTALAFAPGESWDETFEQAGSYNYWCEPHRGAGMVGKVIVE
nr:plastocyanin [Synechococcus sp. 1G10]